MKIIDVQLDKNPETLAPEMTVTIKMSMELTQTIATEAEQEALLGKALMDAFRDYTRDLQ